MPTKPLSSQERREKLARQLDRQLLRLYPSDPERRQAFAASFMNGTAAKPSLIWLDPKPAGFPFETLRLTDWQPDWIDVLTTPSDKPAQHPLYKEGAYYPLDFSSVAVASALLAIQKPIATILDVCSAPGGKSIFAWRAFSPQTLLCNEVIKKRHQSLRENLDRCKVPGKIIQQDPAQLAANYTEACDLVLIDAPCSGQSLPARGIEAAGAFQEHLINMNMSRQRRIIAESAKCVAPGGYLLYSTCTYSREENEKVIEWFLKQNSEFMSIKVLHLDGHRSTLTNLDCYRFEPQQGLGAGGFAALLVRSGLHSSIQ